MEINKPIFIDNEEEERFYELRHRCDVLSEKILSWDGDDTEQIADWLNDYEETIYELSQICGEDITHLQISWKKLTELGQNPDYLERFNFSDWYDNSPILAAGTDGNILIAEHKDNHERVRVWEAIAPSDDSTWKK